jgi:hypothetical protein
VTGGPIVKNAQFSRFHGQLRMDNELLKKASAFFARELK